jgi:uncharacterized small protein (DUF1192 family)
MYEEAQMKVAGYGQISGAISGTVMHNPTLAQNIDQRIAAMKSQVERLERVKALLAEPAGILNVPIDDLRFAMSY